MYDKVGSVQREAVFGGARSSKRNLLRERVTSDDGSSGSVIARFTAASRAFALNCASSHRRVRTRSRSSSSSLRVRFVLGSPLRTCVDAVSFSISNHTLPVSPTRTDPNLTTGTHFASLKTARFASLRAHRALSLGRSSRARLDASSLPASRFSASSRIVSATETPSASAAVVDGDVSSSSIASSTDRGRSRVTVGVVIAIASHIASVIIESARAE